MNELMVRIWDVANKCYLDLSGYPSDIVITANKDDKHHGHIFIRNSRPADFIVEKYLGIKDQDGTPIYQNDIISQEFVTARSHEDGDESISGKHIGVAQIIPSMGVVMYKPLCFIETSGDPVEHRSNGYVVIRKYRSKVIGNINEHKPLLEGVK